MNSSGEQGRIRRHTQEYLTDALIVILPPLQLLGDGVDVAKTSFERVCLKNRGRADHVKNGIRNSRSLVNRPG